jgi:peptide/nickel transport system substrate-binding protein
VKRTMRMSSRAKLVGAVLAMALVGAGASPGVGSAVERSNVPAAAEPQAGGVLRYDVGAEIDGWLPYQLGGSAAGEDRGAMVFDTLLKALPDGTWAPNLATDMTTTDGITWTMALREGVQFTDGTPFDAGAVVVNVQNMQNPDNGSPSAAELEVVTSVAAVDATTVEFVLADVDGDFPFVFTGLPGQIGSPTALADPAAFAEQPVGAGPFILEEWVRDSTATLVRNPDYWDAPKPYLDGIEVRVIPEATVRAQDLVSGNADVVSTDAAIMRAVNDDASGDFVNHTEISTGAIAVWPNTQVTPFDDVRVREAIANAFDYHLVNSSLLLGAWPEERLVCPPFAENMEVCIADAWIQPDLALAQALIDEYVADGGEIAGPYRLLITNVQVAEGALIQQTLATIGIETEIVTLPNAEYVDAQVAHDFDLVHSGISPFTGQNPRRQLWRNLDPEQRNTANVSDPELHDLIDTASRALDEADRIAAAQEILRYNRENFLAIWYGPNLHGLSGRVGVNLGDRYNGGVVAVAQDIWIAAE